MALFYKENNFVTLIYPCYAYTYCVRTVFCTQYNMYYTIYIVRANCVNGLRTLSLHLDSSRGLIRKYIAAYIRR